MAQDRVEVDVPNVDAGAITIDGMMDEAAWSTAGEANLVTDEEFNIWINPYGRENMVEPEYDAFYGRLLWAMDTLYLFLHIDEFVNDSTDLFWNGQWTGDQIFVGLSARLGEDMLGWYDGNYYRSPEGPYHFWVIEDEVTLNMDGYGDPMYIPEEFRWSFEDSLGYFSASDICRWATKIDTNTGLWDIEMAIYNPHVNAQSSVAFNIGGSIGSEDFYWWSLENWDYGDAYAYFCWQASVPDDPFATPDDPVDGDPGSEGLKSTKNWAMLNFLPDPGEIVVRKVVEVPEVAEGHIVIDGIMDESGWATAGEANLVTDEEFNIWINPYGRENMIEPEYDAFYGRLLWAMDTLYLFLHIDEFVNDSTDLFWNGQWTGDQIFVGLSARLGEDMLGWYDGNYYRSPEGPYHFWVIEDEVTLNMDGYGDPMYIPEQFRWSFEDSLGYFSASDICRWATKIDTNTGLWDIEMAIYNPNVNAQAVLGFDIGGSIGSEDFYWWSLENWDYGDAYAYFSWQASVPDDPFSTPDSSVDGDPGSEVLKSSKNWAVLEFGSGGPTGIRVADDDAQMIRNFTLDQNYPNPFNPSTTIRFNLAKKSPITLKVYNAIGQKVATLIDNKPYNSGSYLVTWEVDDLASGVYFYELVADGFRQTKKMVFMK
jgi:hypothetical protein